MTKTQKTRRAKRVLSEAAAHVGPDVIVLAPGVNGAGYLATSLPMQSAENIDDAIVLVAEALKKLRRWRRERPVTVQVSP